MLTTSNFNLYTIARLAMCSNETTSKMFNPNTGVEAFVRPYKGSDAYTEYSAPLDSPFYTGDTNARYIEAITDKRFEMVVRLRPNFDFKGHSHVRILWDIDGTIAVSQVFKKPGKAMMLETINKRSWQKVGDQVRRFGFTFGEIRSGKLIQIP